MPVINPSILPNAGNKPQYFTNLRLKTRVIYQLPVINPGNVPTGGSLRSPLRFAHRFAVRFARRFVTCHQPTTNPTNPTNQSPPTNHQPMYTQSSYTSHSLYPTAPLSLHYRFARTPTASLYIDEQLLVATNQCIYLSHYT